MSDLSNILREFGDKAIKQDDTCKHSLEFRNARMTGIMAVEVYELRNKIKRLEANNA